MKKDSGAEFAMLQDNEIKVFDLKELEHCILTLINQNKEFIQLYISMTKQAYISGLYIH